MIGSSPGRAQGQRTAAPNEWARGGFLQSLSFKPVSQPFILRFQIADGFDGLPAFIAELNEFLQFGHTDERIPIILTPI